MSAHKQIQILLAGRDETALSDFKAALAENQALTAWAKSGSNAVARITEGKFDLVITDENLGDMTGLECIRKIVQINPMINSAAVSSLLPDNFHEASEGLGVLMQLPATPGRGQAAELLEKLKHILDIATPAALKSV
jgi:CheY-like chemotaxis protein